MLRATALALACLVGAPAIAAESPTYGKQLEGFSYPHPSGISTSSPRASTCRWATWMCQHRARSMAAAWC